MDVVYSPGSDVFDMVATFLLIFVVINVLQPAVYMITEKASFTRYRQLRRASVLKMRAQSPNALRFGKASSVLFTIHLLIAVFATYSSAYWLPIAVGSLFVGVLQLVLIAATARLPKVQLTGAEYTCMQRVRWLNQLLLILYVVCPFAVGGELLWLMPS